MGVWREGCQPSDVPSVIAGMVQALSLDVVQRLGPMVTLVLCRGEGGEDSGGLDTKWGPADQHKPECGCFLAAPLRALGPQPQPGQRQMATCSQTPCACLKGLGDKS